MGKKQKAKKPIRSVRVKGFQPSRNGFRFPNRFQGIPLPDALQALIDTSRSVHGLCGGMCFSVIDHVKAGREVPPVDSVPADHTRLYDYLSRRQWESWGTLSVQVLRYVQWMTYSDARAQAETFESWEQLKHNLDHDELTVIGLVYSDLRESLRVWDNHQVLAYGYTVMEDGSLRIHVYDPNYPKNDEVFIEAERVRVHTHQGENLPGLSCAQYVGIKKVHDIHGFLIVPYQYTPPPSDLA